MSIKKKIVRYDNCLNRTFGLNRLSKSEINILFDVFQRMSDQRTDCIKLSATEIRREAELPDAIRGKRYIKILSQLCSIMMHMEFHFIREDGAFVRGVLFPTFALSEDKQTLEVYTNPRAKPVFYDLTGNFSLFEFQQFLSLDSVYSKALFRYFIQHFDGSWSVSAEDLRQMLALDKKSTYANFLSRLETYLEEIRECGYFESVTVELIHARTRGSPIKEFVFHYKKNVSLLDKTSSPTSADVNEEPPFPAEAPVPVEDPPVYDPKKLRTPAEIEAAMRRQPNRSQHKTSSKKPAPETPPTCPKCGAAMYEAKRHSDGKPFWGCTRHPECDGSRPR